jgi:sporulation protein YlmC with PRC-barrel domain
MDIPMGVEVHCTDGLCGRSTYVVLDPRHKEVTHVVVKEARSPHMERLVPIETVSGTAPEVILLDCTGDELKKMSPFVQTEYVLEEMPDLEYSPGGFVPVGAIWSTPYPVPDRAQVVAVGHKQVPLGERAIRRGSRVQATDGHVGRVDELIVHPEDRQITHLVMREGHLWGQREIVIPISDVDHIEAETVYLKLSKDQVEALETIPVR